LDLARVLVITEQRRSGATEPPLEADEHQNRVAADVVVHVRPVRVADRMNAVLAAAVIAIGNARGLCVVRGGKREGTTAWKERLELAGGELRAEAGARRGIEKASAATSGL